MPLAKNTDSKISEDEYLQGELISEVKHEYINGYVYAMAGASRNHNRISNNLIRELGNDLKQKKISCEVFSTDMKVRVSEENTSFFYPDVLVTCDPDDNDSEYYVTSSVIIVEVLSKSTRKYDLTTKKLYYFNIPTLEEYVVIEQDICEVEVFRKSDDWRSTSYFLGDEITCDSIQTTISVEDIYYHVDNEDTVNFLKEKEDN
ncbi:MAG: Uma2 family endonuclease [Pseudomonadota bacterium]